VRGPSAVFIAIFSNAVGKPSGFAELAELALFDCFVVGARESFRVNCLQAPTNQ